MASKALARAATAGRHPVKCSLLLCRLCCEGCTYLILWWAHVSCCAVMLAFQVNKGAWASWNFLGESGTSTDASSDAAVTVSYWLNRLQVGGQLKRQVALAQRGNHGSSGGSERHLQAA